MQEKQKATKRGVIFAFFIMIIIFFCCSTKIQAREFDGKSYGQTAHDLIEFAASSYGESEIKLTNNITIIHEAPATGDAIVVRRDLTIDLNGQTLIIQTKVANSNGIKVENESELTIVDSSYQKSGRLNVSYENGVARNASISGYGAGINTTGGTLIVISGSVSAITNGEGAGIGGGKSNIGGTVVIENGSVVAESSYGAGIGGGVDGSGGIVSIENGNVTAKSTNGAGIGSGMSGASGGIIHIGNGLVTAESTSGAGIGGGLNSSGGVLTMSGGTVIAKSANGAGIGGDRDSVGVAKISGGSLIRLGGSESGRGESPIMNDLGTFVYPVEIRVADASSNIPIDNITISVINSAYTAFTDTNGYACIWLPNALQTVNFSVPRYMSINQTVDPMNMSEIWAISLDRVQLPEINGAGGASSDIISLSADYVNFSKEYSITGISTPIVSIIEDQYFIKPTISSSGLLQIPNGLAPGSYRIKIKASNGALPDAILTVQIDIEYPEGYEHPAKDFVTRLYDGIFLRVPDQEGLSFWFLGLIKQEIEAAEAAYFFFTSPEMESLELSDIEYVERLYTVMMGRASDAEGLYFWLNVLDKGAARGDILDYFLYSEEFTDIVRSFGLRIQNT